MYTYLQLVIQLVLLVRRLIGALAGARCVLQLRTALALRGRGLAALVSRHCDVLVGEA